MNNNNSDESHEKIYFVDYPYIGIGEKSFKHKRKPTEEDLERIIGG